MEENHNDRERERERETTFVAGVWPYRGRFPSKDKSLSIDTPHPSLCVDTPKHTCDFAPYHNSPDHTSHHNIITLEAKAMRRGLKKSAAYLDPQLSLSLSFSYSVPCKLLAYITYQIQYIIVERYTGIHSPLFCFYQCHVPCAVGVYQRARKLLIY